MIVGIGIPVIMCLVLSLNSLQNCAMFTPRCSSKTETKLSLTGIQQKSIKISQGYFTCPSEGPSGGEGDALPAAIYVRRTPLNCLVAILNVDGQSQVTLRVITSVISLGHTSLFQFFFPSNLFLIF